MHHPTSSLPSTSLCCHIHEALNLSMHVTIRYISSIFAPLARKDAATGRLLRHGWYGIAHERQYLSFVQIRTSASTRGEKLLEKWRIDHTDKWLVVVDERD